MSFDMPFLTRGAGFLSVRGQKRPHVSFRTSGLWARTRSGLLATCAARSCASVFDSACKYRRNRTARSEFLDEAD